MGKFRISFGVLFAAVVVVIGIGINYLPHTAIMLFCNCDCVFFLILIDLEKL